MYKITSIMRNIRISYGFDICICFITGGHAKILSVMLNVLLVE